MWCAVYEDEWTWQIALIAFFVALLAGVLIIVIILIIIYCCKGNRVTVNVEMDRPINGQNDGSSNIAYNDEPGDSSDKPPNVYENVDGTNSAS